MIRTTSGKKTSWKKISPGVYSREIPKSARSLDREFVGRVALTVKSHHLREILSEISQSDKAESES